MTIATRLTFATEAERLKAREQFYTIGSRIFPYCQSLETWFDQEFPPIAPPKMVPFELNAQVDNEGRCIELEYVFKSTAIDPKTTRETRVRVTEIDDE